MTPERRADSAAVLNGIIEKHVGLPVSEIKRMTPDERARYIRESNGYGTSITTANTRGISGRGSVLASLGKTVSASEARHRFDRLLS